MPQIGLTVRPWHVAAGLFAIAAAAVLCSLPRVMAQETQSQPASATAADVPDEAIVAVARQLNPESQVSSQDEWVKMMVPRAEQAIALGKEIEAKFPNAKNLHLVRQIMLRAAMFLQSQKKDQASAEQLAAIAERVMSSDAPVDEKAFADTLLTRQKAAAAGDASAKIISDYLARYEKTDQAFNALMSSAMMAFDCKQRKLLDEICAKLDQPGRPPQARDMLRRVGWFDGKPFKAELTLLDGKKLTLPDDMKGKVVILDFWATWCRPCIATLPHIKELYAKYKPQGVEMVGISLDDAKDKDSVAEFVKTQDMTWMQTMSGQGWDDATAKQYGVQAIPAVCVIGKDGNVVTADAYGENGDPNNVAAFIEQAIKGTPATAPASQPATAKD